MPSWMLEPQILRLHLSMTTGRAYCFMRVNWNGPAWCQRQATAQQQHLGPRLEQLSCSKHEAVHVIMLFTQPRRTCKTCLKKIRSLCFWEYPKQRSHSLFLHQSQGVKASASAAYTV